MALGKYQKDWLRRFKRANPEIVLEAAQDNRTTVAYRKTGPDMFDVTTAVCSEHDEWDDKTGEYEACRRFFAEDCYIPMTSSALDALLMNEG